MVAGKYDIFKSEEKISVIVGYIRKLKEEDDEFENSTGTYCIERKSS